MVSVYISAFGSLDLSGPDLQKCVETHITNYQLPIKNFLNGIKFQHENEGGGKEKLLNIFYLFQKLVNLEENLRS